MRHRVYKDDILTVVVEYVNVGAMTNNNIWEAQVKTCHIRTYRTCCLKLISKLLGIPLRCTHQISFFSFNLKEVLSRTFFCIFRLISQMFLAYPVLHPFKHVNVKKCLLCKHSGERMTCIAETVHFLLRRRVQWIFHE